ncbi:hypothetical protein EJ110_NYTH23911 [Nymphaea thermarum]|nr:hypothetical protein EJ110_NYTH23911 [Nymphaea thermarum]
MGDPSLDVLRILDSLDEYLTLSDSLSSTLRQGWLDLAGARHSMGTSRVTSAVFDLKPHPAAATLNVKLEDESVSEGQQKEQSANDEVQASLDAQVQKQRSKLLSVYGVLVSPKLRGAQISFERAIQTIVDLANARARMMAAFERIERDMKMEVK